MRNYIGKIIRSLNYDKFHEKRANIVRQYYKKGRLILGKDYEELKKAKSCSICGIKFRRNRRPQIDHIIPLRQGGTNERSNLRPVCKKCHSELNVTKDQAAKPIAEAP